MSQGDVLEFLEKNRKEWYSEQEIRKLTKKKINSKSFQQLRHYKLVFHELVNKGKGFYQYVYKYKKIKQ